MGLELTETSDPKNSKDIAVSTTTRIMYRKMYPDYAGMRNVELNEIIAKDYAQHASGVIHLFWISKDKRILAEIRTGRSGTFYISAIRGGTVDILTIQSSWFKPKYKPRTDAIEMGDE